jgi:vacuolar-type H+-ATPase subunit D/Vma8
MGRVMSIAAFSLSEVTYAVGGSNISYQIQESVKTARFRLRTKQENVSGVFLPQFESFTTNDAKDDFGLTGLGKGGQQVQRCRETYRRAVETLVELASLQTAFVTLDEVIKVVNRRINAIEHVIIPRTENTIKCENESFPPLFSRFYPLLLTVEPGGLVADIMSELDEMDREEFYRLKKACHSPRQPILFPYLACPGNLLIPHPSPTRSPTKNNAIKPPATNSYSSSGKGRTSEPTTTTTMTTSRPTCWAPTKTTTSYSDRGSARGGRRKDREKIRERKKGRDLPAT